MQLSNTLIAKFQQAHLEEFGQEITAEAAEMALLDLAELVRITQQSFPESEKDQPNDDSRISR